VKGRWLIVSLLVVAFLVGSFFLFLSSLLHLMSGPGGKGDVAIVEVLGGIFDSKETVEQLQELKKDKGVKAIVLRVDSPGGSVGASQEIFAAVEEVKAKKPVVVSMGAVAASGGYYISAGASKIVANPGTITGSIGVRMELMNLEEILQWARLKTVTLKSGRLKDIGSPTRAMTPEEREYLEGILSQMHQQFKKAIAEGRGLPLAEVEKIADGRILTGEQALALKLVDELGTLDRAVKLAGELAGMKEEPESFYPSKIKQHWWEFLVEEMSTRLTKEIASIFLNPMRVSY